MNKPFIIRAIALAELDEAALWYEARQLDLGNDFVAEVERILEIISHDPERFPIVLEDAREAPLKRFPYASIIESEHGKSS